MCLERAANDEKGRRREYGGGMPSPNAARINEWFSPRVSQVCKEQWTQALCQVFNAHISKGNPYEVPRMMVGEAMEQAAAIADRFNRLFLRTLRQLRDLRRYAPAANVQPAEQVNIGGQQVNVAQIQGDTGK